MPSHVCGECSGVTAEVKPWVVAYLPLLGSMRMIMCRGIGTSDSDSSPDDPGPCVMVLLAALAAFGC